MHPIRLRAHARARFADGLSLHAIGRELGVHHNTVRYWCKVTQTPDSRYLDDRQCPRCQDPPSLPADPAQYAYLLGLYLGDGHLVTRARVPVLRIACADGYPGLADECEQAMRATLAKSVQRVRRPGCVDMQAYSVHWLCLLPQAGPGKKHERHIALAPWQAEVVSAHAGRFVRGLFHSDGCRTINHVMKRGKRYAYPRYLFANESSDILEICGYALDLLGIAWRRNRYNCLSVAKREAVAELDRHVGPKS